MFSYAPFTALLPSVLPDLRAEDAINNVSRQIDLLYQHCYDNNTGLVVHGFDASKTHPWADPVSGASPIAWSRSLGWYTVGLVDSLEIVTRLYPQIHGRGEALSILRQRLNELMKAQIRIVAASATETGRHALWQVVGQPGAEGNFVESSGTALVAYALAKASRSRMLSDESLVDSAACTASKMLGDLIEHFVIKNANGTLSFNGTSSVASLSGNEVDFEASLHYGTLDEALTDDSTT